MFRTNELVAGNEVRHPTPSVEHLFRNGLGTERFPVTRFSDEEMIASVENTFFERLLLGIGERLEAVSCQQILDNRFIIRR